MKRTEHRLVSIENMEGCSQCLVCGAAEGELPTDCPGRLMTTEECDGVFQGELDYSGRGWSVKTDDDEASRASRKAK